LIERQVGGWLVVSGDDDVINLFCFGVLSLQQSFIYNRKIDNYTLY